MNTYFSVTDFCLKLIITCATVNNIVKQKQSVIFNKFQQILIYDDKLFGFFFGRITQNAAKRKSGGNKLKQRDFF